MTQFDLFVESCIEAQVLKEMETIQVERSQSQHGRYTETSQHDSFMMNQNQLVSEYL